MADKEQPHHPQHPRRYAPANRARPSYNRIYQHLGVRDLREIIDRKRQERGQLDESGVPPPDPSYNYLKDPSRESDEQNVQDPTKQMHACKPKNSASNSFKRDRQHQEHITQHVRDRDIENPLNIKVEFSTSTGEHVYKFDESTVLPTIKHVPDHRRIQSRPFRGRGRGRGRGPRSYQTRTIRNNRRQPNELVSNDPGNAEGVAPIPTTAEENWDDEVTKTKETSEQSSQECEEYDDDLREETLQSEEKNQQVDDESTELEKGIENLKVNDTLQGPCKNEEHES